jgi:hypothetical protein
MVSRAGMGDNDWSLGEHFMHCHCGHSQPKIAAIVAQPAKYYFAKMTKMSSSRRI